MHVPEYIRDYKVSSKSPTDKLLTLGRFFSETGEYASTILDDRHRRIEKICRARPEKFTGELRRRGAIESEYGLPYLSSYINDRFGTTYSDWINSMRVEKARILLTSTSMSMFTLEQIAYECGFSSQAYYSRIFKTHTGISPSDYKNQFFNK